METAKIRILKKAEAHVITEMSRNDPAHDGAHVERVVALTRKLCTTEPTADPYRTELLAWIHDLSDDKLQTNRDMGSLEQLLREFGVEAGDIEFLIRSVGYISFRKYPKSPEGLPIEVLIVRDADRIDAMGAMGIGRTFAYGGAKGRPMEESIAHFEEKLLHLYDLLSTQGAKTLALPRHKLLTEFYRAYREEQAVIHKIP